MVLVKKAVISPHFEKEKRVAVSLQERNRLYKHKVWKKSGAIGFKPPVSSLSHMFVFDK